MSCRTVWLMASRRMSATAVAVLLACLFWAVSAQASFVPALGSPYPTGAAAHALAVGDADRNATVDVAAGGLRLLRGDGTGRLFGTLAIGAPGAVEGIAFGDLNGDTLRDYVAIAPGSPRRLLEYTAMLGGGYVERTILEDAGAATDVAVAQLDGDGVADVVLVRAEPGMNVSVLRNVGGSYVEGSYASGLPAPVDVAAGDLDRDGRHDLAVTGGDDNVATLLNAGDGTFASGATYGAGPVGSVDRLALGHADGDGRLDVMATGSAGTGAIVVLRGNGAGGLVASGRWATGLPSAPTSIDVSDVNGDGPIDVVAGSAGGHVSLLLGNGAARFAPAADSPFAAADPLAGAVEDVVAADMNHDGQPDVITANGPGSVSVLLNSATGLLAPSPAVVDFGQMAAQSALRTASITFTSRRGRLRITRVDLQGSRAFSVTSRGCVARTLLLGRSCTMSVTYRPPRRAARHEALLSIDANAAAVVVPLGATVRGPVVSRLGVTPRPARPGQRMKLRYRLSEDARVRVLMQQALPGRRVDGECVAAAGVGAKGRRCRAWGTLATVHRRSVAGRRSLRLRARARTGKLAPGLYRLSVSAVDRFRNRSDERSVRFRVAQAARRAK